MSEDPAFVRLAESRDIEVLGVMAVRFWVDEDLIRKKLGIDNLSVESTVRYVLESGMGVIVVAEKSGSLIGFIAGLISPWFAHHQQRIIQEVIWWVNPEERGTRLAYRMIKEYEKEAREKGCCFTIMGTHDADNEDRLIRFYESCGFQHLQYEMIKEL